MSNKIFAMTVVVAFLFSGCAVQTRSLRPDDFGGKVKELKTSGGLEYSILTFQPESPGERFPLVVALHGKGMNGSGYMDLWEGDAARMRTMVITPTWDNWDLKGEARKKGASLEDLSKALDEIIAAHPVDTSRMTLAGLSAGGLAARWLLQLSPSRWKSVVFVAYASSETWKVRLDMKNFPPVLFVHGSEDEQFSTALVLKNSEDLLNAGVTAIVMEQPEAGHEQKPEWASMILQWMDDVSRGTFKIPAQPPLASS